SPARVSSHTTVDVQYNYTLEDIGVIKSATFTVGAINLFNNQPPFVNTDGAFASRVHDPRGRLVYARLRFGF
ncbi:MAG: TonB-dependent receptor, partial [Alphaproteobacteria bacterium]